MSTAWVIETVLNAALERIESFQMNMACNLGAASA